MRQLKSLGKVNSRSADSPRASQPSDDRIRRHRSRLLAVLLLGFALPVLSGCPRPSSSGLVGRSVPPEASGATVPSPLAEVRPKLAGRSGPPPLGLARHSPGKQYAVPSSGRAPMPAAAGTAPRLTRTTPAAPPPKPDKISRATEKSDRPADDRELPRESTRAAREDGDLPADSRPPEAEPSAIRETAVDTPNPKSGGLGRAPGALDGLLDGPDGLMGLTSKALTLLLGSPALVRHDAPARIWQYQQLFCVFDIFLYEEEGEFRVAYFEARDHKARKQSLEPCFSKILGHPAPSSSG